MNTINISLPTQLKSQADTYIQMGYYASFSDLVRDSIRQLIAKPIKSKYDLMAEEAIREQKAGNGYTASNSQETHDHLTQIFNDANQ